MSNTSNLYKNTSIYVVGEIFPRLLSFITFPILTTYLTPADYGINSFVASITSLLFILSNLSLSTYFYVHYYRLESDDARIKMMGTLGNFTNFNSVFLILLLIFFGPFLFKIWGSKVDFYPYIFLGLIGMFFEVLVIYPSAIYRVLEKPIILIIFNIAKAVTNVLGILLVVFILKGTLRDIILIQTIISGVFSVGFFIYSREFYTFIIDKEILQKSLRFSLPLVPASLSWYVYSTFDRILIDKYLTLNDLGLYSTATTFALMLNIFTNSAYKAFEPVFYKHFGSEEFSNIYFNTKRIFIYFTLIGSLILSLFAKEFFIVFSSKSFFISYKFIPFILIGTVCSSIGLIYATIISAMGKTKQNALITILGAFLSITINVILIKTIGIWGAIFSSVATYIITLILRIFVSKNKLVDLNSIYAFITAFAPAIFFNTYVEGISFYFELVLKFAISIMVIIMISLFLKVRFIKEFNKLLNTK